MAVIVSVASGKGGVGKSTTVSNLGVLLARSGLSVVLIDLDVGGADLHVMLGELSPKRTLTDFLDRRVERLEDVVYPIGWCTGLHLIAGTGETLRTTNPAVQTKKKLERHVRGLHADVVLLDIGAGTNYHALDFFSWADLPIVVSTPDPTAVLDLYKFLKLAATRRLVAVLGSRDPAADGMAGEDFGSLEQLRAAAREAGPEVAQQAEETLRTFKPALVFNAAGQRDQTGMAKVTSVIRRFLGSEVDVLGSVPDDPAVTRSVRRFLPVAENDPDAPAARAYAEIAAALRRRIDLLAAARADGESSTSR